MIRITDAVISRVLGAPCGQWVIIRCLSNNTNLDLFPLLLLRNIPFSWDLTSQAVFKKIH